MTLLELARKHFSPNARPVGQGWVMFSCPFAPWRHTNGDKHPSFGISEDGGFNCFGCRIHGPLSRLPRELARYTRRYDYALERDIKKFLKNRGRKKIKKEIQPIHDDFLRDLPDAPEIMGLTKEDIEKWQIKFDPTNKALVYPLYDRDKNLRAIKFRYLSDKKFFLFDPSDWKKTELYGIHLPRKKYVFLVEGDRDTILLSRYVHTLGFLGNPSDGQLRTVRALYKAVVLFLDDDKEGHFFKELCYRKFKGFLDIYEVVNYYGAKDPAEIVERNLIRRVLKKSNLRRKV